MKALESNKTDRNRRGVHPPIRKKPTALDEICPWTAFQLRAIPCPDSTGNKSSSTRHPLRWPEEPEDEMKAAATNLTSVTGRLLNYTFV